MLKELLEVGRVTDSLVKHVIKVVLDDIRRKEIIARYFSPTWGASVRQDETRPNNFIQLTVESRLLIVARRAVLPWPKNNT